MNGHDLAASDGHSDVSEPAAPSTTNGTALTPREIEIVQFLAEGKSNRAIATELGISVRTVEAHRAHVMRKLHLRSVVDLVYYALSYGIVSPP
jgi:DNA-binding NarL/FixJ family response regulator